jgi:hypothetical protein
MTTFHKSFDLKIPAGHTDAAASYRAELGATEALLRRLAAKLDQHKTKQAANPKNWGYVGDLQHINSLLCQALGGAGFEREACVGAADVGEQPRTVGKE